MHILRKILCKLEPYVATPLISSISIVQNVLNSITQTNICMISVVSQKFYYLIKIPGQGLRKWRCHSKLIEVCVWWEKRGGGKKKISPLKNTNWKKISTKKNRNKLRHWLFECCRMQHQIKPCIGKLDPENSMKSWILLNLQLMVLKSSYWYEHCCRHCPNRFHISLFMILYMYFVYLQNLKW